jgi:hypothetical protein
LPIEKIRAKEGNVSIPLYVGGESQANFDGATETASTALPEALTRWLETSAEVRRSLRPLLVSRGTQLDV